MNNEGTNAKLTTKHILLGVTGSVAAVKCPALIDALSSRFLLFSDVHAIHIKCLLTKAGSHFLAKSEAYDLDAWNAMQSYMNNCNSLVKVDMIEATEEWDGWDCIGDPVLHIDLRNWADLLLIAPLSAHTLAKIANGSCDDTLSCVVRAWNFDRNFGKPLILAPAMNTAMWNHPLTASQLKTIKSFGMGAMEGKEEDCKDGLIHVVDPTVKTLACGELGSGALADISDIVLAVEHSLNFAKGA